MKKKIVPVLVVLALVAVGGAGYFMGQQSNATAAETPPAESSTPEVTPDTTPDATPTTPAVETTSPEPSVEPEKEMVFSGDYRNVILAETLPIYGTPHDTVDSIGEYHRFDVIEPAELSEDSKWYRAKDEDGNYFYYKSADLSAGLSDDDITRLCGEYAALQKQQPQQPQTPTPQPETPAPTSTPQPEQTTQPKQEETKQPEQPSSSGDSIPDYLKDAFVVEEAPQETGTTEGSSTISEDWTPGDDVAGIVGPGSTPPPSVDNADTGDNQTSNSVNPGTGTGYTDMTNDPDVEVWDFDETNSEDTDSSGHVGEGTGAGLTIIG